MRRLAVLVVLAACGGGGGEEPDAQVVVDIDAPPECDYTTHRAQAPQVIVGPAALEDQVRAFIDGASVELSVQMYNFTLDALANRLIAAHNRGVFVSVLLDPNQGGNESTRSQLAAAGVRVQFVSGFPNAHAKYILRDNESAFILSGNFTVAGMDGQRNYGVIDRDRDDVEDLTEIFLGDWDGYLAQLECTRLVVSPADARTRVLAHIANATQTLDAELFYIADTGVRQAIISAHQRGVRVRVLLADPSDLADNATTADVLAAAGVPVRTLATPDVHAKLLVADGVGLIGSHNMSSTSLRDNREIGIFVREGGAMAPVTSQFTADWNAATPW